MTRLAISNRTANARRYLIRDMGKSLMFNGTSDRATLPFAPSSTAFSFCIWVRADAVTASARVMDYSDGGPSGGFTLQIVGSKWNFVVYNLTAMAANFFSSLPISTGVWYHLAGTYQQDNVDFYVNGVIGTTDVSATMTAPTQTLSLARRSNAATNFFAGNIDDFLFVSGRKITSAEVLDHYLKGSVPSDATCQLNFNDNVTDQSGNSNNATLTGTSYASNVAILPRRRIGMNVIPNGNFEVYPAVLTANTNTAARWIDGTAAGSASPRGMGWAAPSAGSGVGANAEAGFDTTIKRSGNASLKLSNLNASGAVTVSSYRNAPSATTLGELFSLAPNTEYILTGYIRTNNVPTNGAFIDVREFNAAGTTLATTSTNKLSGTDSTFRTVTITITTNASTTYGNLFLRNNVAGNTCDAWFDDITLTRTVINRKTP